MHLSEASRKARRNLWLGWTVLIASIVILFVCMLRVLFESLPRPEPALGGRLFRLTNNGVAYLYDHIPFMHILWPHLPSGFPSLTPLLSSNNLTFAGLALFFAWGYLLRDSGLHLSRRIARQKERAEESGWQRSLTGEVGRPEVLALQIDLERRDQWYERPLGIVLLSIVAAYLAALLVQCSGLSG